MSNEAKLGTTPTIEDGRDAVHIAIVPVRAAEALKVGAPVRLNSHKEAESCAAKDAIGIVDPFRHEKGLRGVSEGEVFWLCLYPKTITGLRHVWEHPAFPASSATEVTTPPNKKEDSEAWLRAYVKRYCSYWEDLDDAGYSNFINNVKEDRMIHYCGSDCHCLDDVENADELFFHLSVVLDQRIDASYFESFTCSC